MPSAVAVSRGNDVNEAGAVAGEGEEEHVELHKAADPAICEWRAASVSVVWCGVHTLPSDELLC